MTKEKHTPAPWFFRKQHNGSLDLFGDGGKRVITSGLRFINQEPNIHLIAAAPEMFEALTEIKNMAEWGMSGRARNEVNYKDIAEIAQKAIEKAKGNNETK